MPVDFSTVFAQGTLPWWVVPIIIWEVVWKGIGMWKSARHSQKAWFIAILMLNTAGILPIVYIVWFQKGKKKRR